MDYNKNYNEYANYVRMLVFTLKRPHTKIEYIKLRKEQQVPYYEFHHVIPKCLGGDDSEYNLIPLTAREHFLAHYLLTKLYSGNNHYKMMYAFRALCNLNKTTKRVETYCNSTLYERNKIKINEAQSIIQKQTPKKYSYWLNKKQPKELIEKRCVKLRGQKRTAQSIQNIKNGLGDNWKIGIEAMLKKTRKQIRCNETGQIFNSYNEAARIMKLSQGNISSVVAGERKHTKGYTFSKI